MNCKSATQRHSCSLVIKSTSIIFSDFTHQTSVCVTQTLKMLQKAPTAQNPGKGPILNHQLSEVKFLYRFTIFMPTLLSQKWNKLHFGWADRFQHKSNLWDGPLQNYERIKWRDSVDKTKVPEITPRFMCGSKHHVFQTWLHLSQSILTHPTSSYPALKTERSKAPV